MYPCSLCIPSFSSYPYVKCFPIFLFSSHSPFSSYTPSSPHIPLFSCYSPAVLVFSSDIPLSSYFPLSPCIPHVLVSRLFSFSPACSASVPLVILIRPFSSLYSSCSHIPLNLPVLSLVSSNSLCVLYL